MNERQKQLFVLFKMAIEAEHAAQEMYSNLLTTADDDELRSIITQLRRDEARHEQVLLEEYAKMRTVFAD